MHTWQQGVLFLAGHESRGCCVFISDVGIFSIYLSPTLGPAAGPVSLEDYFQKVALLGQQPELNLWNVDTMSNSKKKLFPSICRSVKFGV